MKRIRYYMVYIVNKDRTSRQEIARFTSKGVMAVCIESIKALYAFTDYTVTYDRD